MSVRQIALIAAGVVYLVVGVLAFLAPVAFYNELAAYPPRNDHFIRDLGTWNIGLGLVALYAQRHPTWHRPVLGIIAVQYALHTISHAIDAGETSPEWQSWFALVFFALATLVLAGLAAYRPREGASASSRSL